jgi:preprotein translocase subunit SecG
VDILLLVLHVFLSLGIITLVLLQKGAGASAGASFGGGAGSVFGASGSANFLSKTTAFFAAGFFINSLVLAYLAAHRDMQGDSVLDVLTPPAIEAPGEAIPVPELNVPAADDSAQTNNVPVEADASSDGDVPPPAGE